MKSLGIFSACLLVILISCTKDSFITSPDARLRITADTLKYDTLFVSAGSTYQTFKIINENEQKLRLSSIKLMGGNASVYKINVDGVPGVQFNDIVLEPNDSVYVFAQVNINPGSATMPFILRDSIEIVYNGIKKQVQLEAWGQNAHFYRDRIITANETWNNDLPYVILGSLFVNTNQTLTINKGCRIYVHADAPIVVNGSLLLNGLKDSANRIYFQGDRLDEPYKDFPASWPGIYLQPSSKDNVFNYAVLKNSFQAIVVQDPSTTLNAKLTLNECIIDNAYDIGIAAVNSSIRAKNCLISNCGRNLFLVKGGDYQFTHCTVATYANRFNDHRDPVLTLSNYTSQTDHKALNAVFRNCIFWGENGFVENEVKVERLASTTFPFIVNFENILWKVQLNPANTAGVTVLRPINNINPQFDSINTFKNYYSFRLKPTSPAVDIGDITTVNIDLNGNSRPVRLPDLGSYERR